MGDTSSCTVLEKTRFSMVPEHGDPAASDDWLTEASRSSYVIMGLETHVCVQQTVLDLLAMEKDVHVVVDCVTSQRNTDREIAIERMKQAGAFVTTSESVMFELLRCKEHPHFKA